MIVIDTNVVSKLMRLTPSATVKFFMDAQVKKECFISAITEAKWRFGIATMPPGHKHDQLYTGLRAMLGHQFGGRILPFTSDAAKVYAIVAGDRRRLGRPISQMDGTIAAIARLSGAAMATRNMRDFVDCGISLIDPWNQYWSKS